MCLLVVIVDYGFLESDAMKYVLIKCKSVLLSEDDSAEFVNTNGIEYGDAHKEDKPALYFVRQSLSVKG